MRKRQFDYRWLLLFTLLIIIIAVCLIKNVTKIDNSSSKISETTIIDDGDEKIDWTRFSPINIELSESYKITKSGVYHLTGSIEDGLITIDTNKKDVVKLILDNVSIKNTTGPAILCLEGDDLVIELVGTNYLEDGETYSDISSNEDIKGALYSKADLTFEGNGTLNITSNYGDGIISKDDLKIKSGTYNIVAHDDAIRGKDSVYIKNGYINLEALADGIKSTNEVTPGKGFVLVENGVLNIKTGAKGIKSTNSILIYDGEYNINSFDDAIHSNNYIGISGGKFDIVSGDDGIHADSELIIDDGVISITKSYEALEAQVVTINGGQMSLVSSDDGINAGGGADSSAMNRMGANPFNVEEDCVLSINGGDIYIDAAGDGVDSNGYLYFKGGKTVIDGPTNDGNGALDSGIEIMMTGGEVTAIGASGMAENLGTSSTTYNLSVYFDSIKPADTEIVIKNSKNEIVMSHVSKKSFNHLAFGSSELMPTLTYTIYIDDEEYEKFTISNNVTTVGNSYDIMKKRR